MKRHILGRLRAPFMPHFHKKQKQQDFPGGPVVKNLPANAGTWVWSPDWENTTCCRAAKPVCHSYWACTPELTTHNMRSRHNEKLTLQLESSPGSLQLEKACMQQQRPTTAKQQQQNPMTTVVHCIELTGRPDKVRNLPSWLLINFWGQRTQKIGTYALALRQIPQLCHFKLYFQTVSCPP